MKLSREHVVKDEVSPRRSWLLSYNYPTFIMTLRLRYLDTIVLDLVSVFRYSIGGDPGKSILLVDALFWLWSHHFDWRKKTLRIKFLQYCLVCLTDSITQRGQLSSAVSSVSNFFHSFKVASESTRLMDALRKPSQDGLILNSTCLLIIFATSFVCVEPRSLLIDSSPLVTRGIFLVALIFHGSSSNTEIPRYPLSFKGMQVQMSAKNPVMSDFPASNSSEIMVSRGLPWRHQMRNVCRVKVDEQ